MNSKLLQKVTDMTFLLGRFDEMKNAEKGLIVSNIKENIDKVD